MQALGPAFRVDVLTPGPGGAGGTPAPAGPRVVSVPAAGADLAARLRAFDEALARQLRAEQYASAHVLEPFGGARVLAHGVPCVFEASSLPSVELATDGLPRALVAELLARERRCLEAANRLVCASQATAASLRTRTSRPVEVLPDDPRTSAHRLLALHEAVRRAPRPTSPPPTPVRAGAAHPGLSLLPEPGRVPAPGGAAPGGAAPTAVLAGGGAPARAAMSPPVLPPPVLPPPVLPRVVPAGGSRPAPPSAGPTLLPRIGGGRSGGAAAPTSVHAAAPGAPAALLRVGAPGPPPLPPRVPAPRLAPPPLSARTSAAPALQEPEELLDADALVEEAAAPTSPSRPREEQEWGSPPLSRGDVWAAQVLLGYCPPGARHFARHAPPTTFPGRDSAPVTLAGLLVEPES